MNEWLTVKQPAMSISLVMRTADGGERLFPVHERIVIGRDSRCQVRIALPSVCDQHCELKVVDGRVQLEDLKSLGGTFHNGRRVDRALLVDADMLTIGPVTFEVRFAATEERDQKVTLKPVKDVLDTSADPPEINVLSRPAKSVKPAEG